MRPVNQSAISRIFRAFTFYGTKGTVQNVTDLLASDESKLLSSFADYFNVKIVKQGDRMVLIPTNSPLMGSSGGPDRPVGFSEFWMEQAFIHEMQKEGLKEQFRQERYQHYEFMDLNSTEASLMLDTYADEAVSAGYLEGSPVRIEVMAAPGSNIDSGKIKARLVGVLKNNGILADGMNPTGTRATIRSLAKYGECFFKFIRRYDGAPILIRRMDNPAEVTIHRDVFDKSILGYKYLEQFEFFPWEFTHMRLPDDSFEPYGRSVLEPVRAAYQMLLINEALMSLSRASKVERLIIKIPTVPDNATEAFSQLSAMKALFKSVIFGNTGAAKAQSKIAALTDVLWLPGGEGYEIDKLQSSIDVSAIDDVNYFYDKFLTGTRMPKDYFLASENTQLLGQSLAAQDIKFARALLPLQWAYVEGLTRMCTIILILDGYDPARVKVKVEMSKPQSLTAQMISDAKEGIELGNSLIDSFKNATGAAQVKDSQWLHLMRSVSKIPPHILDYLGGEKNEANLLADRPKSREAILDGGSNLLAHESGAVIEDWGVTCSEIVREQRRKTLLEWDSGRRAGLVPLFEKAA